MNDDPFTPTGPGTAASDLSVPDRRARSLFGEDDDNTSTTDDSVCDCDAPDFALDEADIGIARVQVLWCDRCETILTTVSEVQDGDD